MVCGLLLVVREVHTVLPAKIKPGPKTTSKNKKLRRLRQQITVVTKWKKCIKIAKRRITSVLKISKSLKNAFSTTEFETK